MPTLKVKDIRQDAPNLKTYVFEYNLRAKPGQFIMVWMPGVDEVPMSIGWQTDKEFHLGIADAGDCTHAIHQQIKVGDKLGIRGPYGTNFEYKGYEEIICVGGGAGTPPMLNLAQCAHKDGIKVTMIQGGRSKEHLLYEDLFKKIGVEDLMCATDDGSYGHKGYCTDLLAEKLEAVKGKKVCVYTCGPEVMMVKVIQMAEKAGIDSQVSLERYMKCGFGICGQCCMDDSGMRICKEGPVVSGKRALEHAEFGKYRRSASGKRI
jgi:dihydroorotate dehydrogenase electron transfer subunit